MKLEAKARLLEAAEDEWSELTANHLILPEAELLADTGWWDNMRPETKVKYLRRHPRSRKDKSFVSKHLHKALKDKSVGVRHAAVTHPHATSQMLRKALSDTSPSVRKAAQRAINKRAKK